MDVMRYSPYPANFFYSLKPKHLLVSGLFSLRKVHRPNQISSAKQRLSNKCVIAMLFLSHVDLNHLRSLIRQGRLLRYHRQTRSC